MHFDDEEIRAMKLRLLEDGYVNDEQSLGAIAFKDHGDAIISDLRLAGYSQPIARSAGYFSGNGNVYWMHNPDLVSANEARCMTRRWVNDREHC
ncbi:hypothetical protein AB838_11870 [Rhodobacteraceae bacterium (ex Bugula neritina AB1)]|nr:hypothetical protein AB838_11870 [Rhodobacteraceae bacterium (ex Bugula neritina AB1)]